MKETTIALLRATKFLQERGYFRGMNPPARMRDMLAAFREIDDRIFDAAVDNTNAALVGFERSLDTLFNLIQSHGIYLGECPEIDGAEASRKRRQVDEFRAADRQRKVFYSSREWRELRYAALLQHGCRCMACGRDREKHGVVIHVDHIKPRSKFPHLALDINNLQILCEDCNLGKNNWDDKDWRTHSGRACV